jgi:hypothetical protein
VVRAAEARSLGVSFSGFLRFNALVDSAKRIR